MGLIVITLHQSYFSDLVTSDVMQVFASIKVCKLFSWQSTQGGVHLVACPVLGTPKLHHIKRWEFIFEYVI